MNYTCAFTGHRPKKLPGGYNWFSNENIKLGKTIRKEVEKLVEEKRVNKFIFGGALGVDQMAFQVVYKLKKTKYSNLCLTLAMPFEHQDAKWIKESKSILHKQKQIANKVVLVDELEGYSIKEIPSKIYHPLKMQKRNEYMVDNAKYLIAVWDGSNGGTKNCIDYYKKRGDLEDLIIINPNIL